LAYSQDELTKAASWSIPTTAEVKAKLDDYLTTKSLDATGKAKIEALWPDESLSQDGGELLDRLTASLAVAEPKAAEIVDACRSDDLISLAQPKFAGLTDKSLPPLVRDNLRLLVGRWQAQHDLVDESLETFTDLATDNVVDPATLLFYQAMGQHRLLKKDECLTAVTKLMERSADLPRRYVMLARLMEADIKPLKEDSLDEIARMMDDIRRRLALARAGKTVRDEEDEVVKKLEKMIDDLEKQRQMMKQQRQQASRSGRQPNQPMQDSQRAELKGAGEVDPKSTGKRDGWGNLPPKERQEVYFKRLAQDGVR
jgi:hypothetical protein